jgi:hypothetical protein
MTPITQDKWPRVLHAGLRTQPEMVAKRWEENLSTALLMRTSDLTQKEVELCRSLAGCTTTAEITYTLLRGVRRRGDLMSRRLAVLTALWVGFPPDLQSLIRETIQSWPKKTYARDVATEIKSEW